MAEDGGEDLGVHGVSEQRDEGECEEKQEVEYKEDDGDDGLPVCRVRFWNLMKHDRGDTCAHCNDEPSVRDQSY